MDPTSALPGGTCPLCQSQPGPPRAPLYPIVPTAHSLIWEHLLIHVCFLLYFLVLLFLPFCMFSFCVSPVSLSVHLSVFVSDSWFLCLLLSGLYLYFSLLFCVIPVSLTPPLLLCFCLPTVFICMYLSFWVCLFSLCISLSLSHLCLSFSQCLHLFVYVWLSLSFSVLPSVPLSISIFWSLPHRLPVTPMWLWPGPAPWY